MNLLEVKSVSKIHGEGDTTVHALKKVGFSVTKGEFVAIGRALITHSKGIAQTADRILQVSDGEMTDFGRCGE